MKKEQDLSVEYMGLKLSNPIIASSSPLTADIEKIIELERAGVGAVVLKSIFEEQIEGEAAMLERYNNYPEAADYLRSYLGIDYMAGFKSLIREAKARTSLPVIASINCVSDGKWIEFARDIQDAGADAIELNIFFLPTDAALSGADIEERYLHIAQKVTQTVSIPVSVKLSSRFTNILHIAQELYNRHIKGAVLYNRFFEPGIDVNTLEYIVSDAISSPKELSKSLRYIAITSAVVPQIDLSVSTGIYSGEDAVKAILAGAKTVQLCSTLLVNGLDVISDARKYISDFMQTNSFGHVSDFCGLMNRKARFDNDALSRVQFMKYFPAE